MESNIKTILMGDIIGSELHPSPDRLSTIFNIAVDNANITYATTIVSPLTITLGDEFQGVVGTLIDAFQIAHYMRFTLLKLGIQCRFVAGQAKIETEINTSRAWNMMGEGLSKARDRLNEKRDVNAYRFSLLGHPLLEMLFDAVGNSLTDTELRWTERQMAYVANYIDHHEDAQSVAQFMHVSERAVYKGLKAASWSFYKAQFDAIVKGLKDLPSGDVK